MKASICACLFAGLCASASASGFDASILSHITFDQPWRDLDAWFADVNTSGEGTYTVTPWDAQGFSGNRWGQGARLIGTAVDAGKVSGYVEISTIFWFDFGGEGGALSFDYWPQASSSAWGSAYGAAFDVIQFDGATTTQRSFRDLTAWHSVTFTTRAEGWAIGEVSSVPDCGSTLGFISLVLCGLAHQFQIVARRKSARAGVPVAA